MSLDLQPDDSQIDAPGTKEGYGRLPVGMDKDTCKGLAKEKGAVAWDEHAQACWNVFGREVIIGPDEYDIQEGFEMVNFNFKVNGNKPPVPTQDSLPGPQIIQHTA